MYDFSRTKGETQQLLSRRAREGGCELIAPGKHETVLDADSTRSQVLLEPAGAAPASMLAFLPLLPFDLSILARDLMMDFLLESINYNTCSDDTQSYWPTTTHDPTSRVTACSSLVLRALRSSSFRTFLMEPHVRLRSMAISSWRMRASSSERTCSHKPSEALRLGLSGYGSYSDSPLVKISLIWR